MTVHPEFPQLRAKLKLCNTTYNTLYWIYIAIIILYALSFIPMFFMNINLRGSVVGFIILSVVCIPLNLALEMYAIYRKVSKFAMFAPIPAAIGLIFIESGQLHSLIDLFLVAFSIVNMFLVPYINKQYEYLQQQEGYPYFSDLHTDKMKSSEAARLSDPFEHQEEFYAKEEVRGHMDELPAINETMASKKEEKKNYMDDI